MDEIKELEKKIIKCKKYNEKGDLLLESISKISSKIFQPSLEMKVNRELAKQIYELLSYLNLEYSELTNCIKLVEIIIEFNDEFDKENSITAFNELVELVELVKIKKQTIGNVFKLNEITEDDLVDQLKQSENGISDVNYLIDIYLAFKNYDYFGEF